jgi:hypothetical protein
MITTSFQKQSERSRKRSGAGRKTIVSGCGAVSRTFENGEERERAIGERERSGELKSRKLVERHFSPIPLRSHVLIRTVVHNCTDKSSNLA